jgi:hypothetical protein
MKNEDAATFLQARKEQSQSKAGKCHHPIGRILIG